MKRSRDLVLTLVLWCILVLMNPLSTLSLPEADPASCEKPPNNKKYIFLAIAYCSSISFGHEIDVTN